MSMAVNLSWIGLENQDAFGNLSVSQRNEIQQLSNVINCRTTPNFRQRVDLGFDNC